MLTVQLKRFSFAGMFAGGKINRHISFPEAFDLAPHMSDHGPTAPPRLYDLFGVVVHAGHDVHSGHYYSFVKGSTGTWALFDDQSVRTVPAASVLSARAYILMYKRRLPVAPKRALQVPTPAATATATSAAVVGGAGSKPAAPAAAAAAAAAAAPAPVVPAALFGSRTAHVAVGPDPLGVLPQDLVRPIDLLGAVVWTPGQAAGAASATTPAIAPAPAGEHAGILGLGRPTGRGRAASGDGSDNTEDDDDDGDYEDGGDSGSGSGSGSGNDVTGDDTEEEDDDDDARPRRIRCVCRTCGVGVGGEG